MDQSAGTARVPCRAPLAVALPWLGCVFTGLVGSGTT
jgi:hypothetical protein